MGRTAGHTSQLLLLLLLLNLGGLVFDFTRGGQGSVFSSLNADKIEYHVSQVNNGILVEWPEAMTRMDENETVGQRDMILTIVSRCYRIVRSSMERRTRPLLSSTACSPRPPKAVSPNRSAMRSTLIYSIAAGRTRILSC